MTKLAYTCCAVLIVFAACTSIGDKSPDETKKKPDSVLSSAPTPNPYAPVDISPMDMSYFPVNYSQRKMTHDLTTAPVMRVIYSRPHRQGRKIFGDLLKYGQRWRLGANEASEIELFQPVNIQEKKVSAGRYIIYCIPYQDNWTVILNSDTYTWGLQIDSTKDLMHFDIPVSKSPVNLEYFTMVFQPAPNGAELVMGWDDTEARLPIRF